VCASHCVAHRCLVSFYDHVINGEMHVGKRVIGPAVILFEVFEAAYINADTTVNDDVSGVKLVYCGYGCRLPLLNSAIKRRPSALISFADMINHPLIASTVPLCIISIYSFKVHALLKDEKNGRGNLRC
jgi:hypothetical protein